jgi:serine/threonine protein kinase
MSIPVERLYANRYLLDVQLPNMSHDNCWRAYDQTLNRWVTLHLLDVEDARSHELIESCETAAAIGSRGVIGILDVIHHGSLDWPGNVDPATSYVGIITSWAQGISIDEYLSHSDHAMPTVQALNIVRGAAMTLSIAHDQGVVHGNLTTKSILFVDSGETRIQGFGIDRIVNDSVSTSTISDDIQSLGAALHVMLTQYGPNQDVAIDAVSRYPRVLPSQLRSGIPKAIDELFHATQDGTFASMPEFVEALSITLANLTDTREVTQPKIVSENFSTDSESGRRWVSVLTASLLVIMLGWGGWQLLTHNFNPGGVPVALLPENFADDPLETSSTSPTMQASPTQRFATLTAIKDYDPFGNGEENPELVSKAIDRDSATAWRTVQYRGADLAGKPGLGLLLDLGETSKVNSVSIEFSRAGQGVSIYVSGSQTPPLESSELLGQVAFSGNSQTIRNSNPKTGRYVLVWLTRLPQVDVGTYQSGITEIQVGLS